MFLPFFPAFLAMQGNPLFIPVFLPLWPATLHLAPDADPEDDPREGLRLTPPSRARPSV